VMENLEYSFIVRELKAAEGKHFSNAYRISDGKYRIRIGDIQITLEPGVRLNISKYLPEAIEPDQLVLQMKKVLDNARLVSVFQYSGDRVIIFEFEQRNGENSTLVFEGFGKGNLVLVKDGKTVAAMREETWSDREIKRGKPYSLAKSNVVLNLSDAISDKYVIIAMLKLPLGKEYAKEILSRCGIDEKKPGNSLSSEEIERITSGISALMGDLKPRIVYSEGKIAEFSLIEKPGSSLSKSLSEAVDEFYETAVPEKNEAIEKLERRMKKQEDQFQSLVEEEKQLKAKIDYAYANFEKIDSILQKAKSAKLDELEKLFPGSKIDKKKKEIELEI
jgi:predicted ribosome quality control (RQC) complex YloA/Tae2 family protein